MTHTKYPPFAQSSKRIFNWTPFPQIAQKGNFPNEMVNLGELSTLIPGKLEIPKKFTQVFSNLQKKEFKSCL